MCEGRQLRPDMGGDRIMGSAAGGASHNSNSLLGKAMLEEIVAAAGAFQMLLGRVEGRGHTDHAALEAARSKIEEAAMWARKAVERF